MRVLFLASFFPKPTNPLMGVWALQQAHGLARQPDVEVRVVSFTSWLPRIVGRFNKGARAYSHCPQSWEWDGLHVEYPRWLLCPIGPLKKLAFKNPEPQMTLAFLSARPFLEKVIREWDPDIIFAHHTMANGYLAEKVARKHKIPFVTLDHDFGEVSECARLPARRRTFARIAGRASCVLAVSRRMEDSLNELFPHAYTATQHNGVDPLPKAMWSTPRPVQMQGKVVVLSAGMFYERKGFPLLVEAFARIADNYPNALLRLVGDGETSAAVDAAITKHGLKGRVERLGLLSHADVLQEMAWADIFVSIGWDEPFATVFLEAAAARCAIIWSKDGGVNDVFKNGVHGISATPRDLDTAVEALSSLISDPAQSQEMARQAYSMYNDVLSAETAAASLIALFRNLIETK